MFGLESWSRSRARVFGTGGWAFDAAGWAFDAAGWAFDAAGWAFDAAGWPSALAKRAAWAGAR
jgi:hypothetical protein